MNQQGTKGLAGVIAASSLGTLIEWYNFYIFGSLATIISTKIFSCGPIFSKIRRLSLY